MSVAIAILITTAIGLPVALAIDRNARSWTLIGLAYLYGAGVICFVELVLALAGVRWSAVNVTAIAVAAAAMCFFTGRRTRVPETREPATAVDGATLLTLGAYAYFATLASPWAWDFWAIWGLKARTFFDARTIDWSFLVSVWNDFQHPDYPPLLPLNYVYTALIGGRWDDRWLGLVGVAFGAALLLIVRGLAAKETKPLIASTIAFASTIFALSKFIGLAEAPMIAFGGAGVLFVRRAILFDEDASMRHGALLLGLAAATKNEGLALLAIVAVVVALIRPRAVLRLWPGFAIAIVWIAVRLLHHLPSDLARGSLVDRVVLRLGAIGPISAMLLLHLALRWMWLVMLVALVLVRPELRARERFVISVALLQIATYIAAYFTTPLAVEFHIAASWGRLMQQAGTPLLFVVMLMLAETFRDQKSSVINHQSSIDRERTRLMIDDC